MTRFLAVALALVLAACGGSKESAAPEAGIEAVVIVMRGDEPLPFDPRGSRLTIVSRELARVLGHPITLELEPALSPQYKGSLESSLLASLEGLVRDLAIAKKESPETFSASARLERIVCRYDAVAKKSRGKLSDDGKTIEVFAPPNEYPILERGVVLTALQDAFLEDADKRFADVDPERVAAKERAGYFAYLTRTRPGYGYLYGRNRKLDSDVARLEIVSKVVRLHPFLENGSPTEADARKFLIEHATFVGSKADGRHPEIVREYVAWLAPRAQRMPFEDRATLARLVFEHRAGICGNDCEPDAVLPGFDAFGFGMGIVDEWARAGYPLDGPPSSQGELFKSVVCPVKRSVEANPEIRYGCSAFFARALAKNEDRKRLADSMLQKRDKRLVEVAILNLGNNGGAASALAFVERLSPDDALFRHGVRVLLDDLARREDVQSALEGVALTWWRDVPARRGLSIYILARKHGRLDPHYGDNQWTRLVPELGGPLSRDVYSAYLAEGPRAVELAPTLWPALDKGPHRAELLARALPKLLGRDQEARTARAPAMLAALRRRLCSERDAAGLAVVRGEVARWIREHPDDAVQLSNAVADLTVEKCKAP